MKKHKPTIAAIANEANVSPATVSRVINHRNLVNESTNTTSRRRNAAFRHCSK